MGCRVHLLLILLALGALTGLTREAGAEEQHPSQGRSDGSTTKDHVRRGRRARDAGRWTDAYAAYKAAFEAAAPASSTERERAEIAGELGLCELALRKYRDAAEHLAWSLEQRETLPVALQKRLEEGQRKAAPHVAKLYLSINPPDAEVLVDGKPIGRTARTYALFFEPGQHMVRARAPGREEAFQSFGAVAGTEYNISMQLPRAALSSSKEDSAASRKEAPRAASASPASHGRHVPASPWASWPGALRVAGIAVTTGTVLGGGVFMIRASKLDGDLRERRDGLTRDSTSSSSMCWQAPPDSPCADLVRLRDARNLSAGVGTALVITGGVIGALTAASFFIDSSFLGLAPTQDRIHVAPMATGRETGVWIGGLW
ncbi:PEGA domain-containing protein [Sorangium sp. So ce296]|uniref:PEGA domain-containing protein n=1 Tax=Sorangium sp. So ce296 TaxID=3133296 RepID=UPI003F5FF5A6